MSYIGIDLGTTNSSVGLYDEHSNKVIIIPNEEGKFSTPSIVSFTETNILIGNAAKNNLTINPSNTIYDLKRFIGRTFKDMIIQEDKEFVTYKLEENNGVPIIKIGYKNKLREMKPETIIALILSKMMKIAKEYKHTEIKEAIITVPAHFNIIQRQATKDAGRIAGLNVLRLINEPTAAAITYKLHNKFKDKRNVLIFDLGGGTFDVSIVYLDDDVIEVKSTYGDPHLGGEDFDENLINFCIKKFEEETGINISNNAKSKQRLKKEVEKLKNNLSSLEEASLDIDSLAGGKDFELLISKVDFENMNYDLFKRCIDCVEKAIKYAKLSKKDINDIALVGMSSNIPKMKELLLNFFERKEMNKGFNININPETAVAYGAAYQIYSVKKSLNNLILYDIISQSIKINVNDNETELFQIGTKIPIQKIINYIIEKEKLSIKVFQKIMTYSKKNKSSSSFYEEIGEYIIEGEKNAKIKVTFIITVDNLFCLRAEDSSGKQIKIIENPNKRQLNLLEIKEMEKEVIELNKDIKYKEILTKIKNYVMGLYLKNKDDKIKDLLDYIKQNENSFVNLKVIIEKSKGLFELNEIENLDENDIHLFI